MFHFHFSNLFDTVHNSIQFILVRYLISLKSILKINPNSMKRFLLFFTLLCCGALYSQNDKTQKEKKNVSPGMHSFQERNTELNQNPKIFKDSVWMALRDIGPTKKIDSLWQEKLVNSSLYETMQKAVDSASKIDQERIITEVDTQTLKNRLAMLNARSPMDISYNPSLAGVINFYLNQERKTMERVMALSRYYFPMFEQKLDKYDIPLELKYLAIVESALNPRAKSWVGATGLWQFMYPTGKMMDLTVSSYVDERMDPVKATEAACQYLEKLYGMFDDWNMALAAYNSGPGNVAKAIRRSGGKTDYWEIRDHLPRETAGYVPSFLAVMYVYEFAEEHNFNAYQPEVTYYETDTVRVKDLLRFQRIEEATGIDKELLSFLNPSYKLGIVPYIPEYDYYLRLPRKEAGIFVANEDLIYEYARDKEINSPKKKRYVEADDKIRYRVRSGDYLGRIARKYGVYISQIKKWNHMQNSRISVGQRLTIYPRGPNGVAVGSGKHTRPIQRKLPEKKKSANPGHKTKSGKADKVSVVKTKGSKKTEETKVEKPSESKKAQEPKYYTVESGDSLWSISRKIKGVTVKEIKKWNGIGGTSIKPGMRLKVSEV
jgi:membrane-bound lytic murein transglycosylase D